MQINEKIRLLRESREWSQEEMATKLAMTAKGYAKIERGETRSNLPRLEQIAKVFDLDIFELLSYGEDSRVLVQHSGNNNSLTNSTILLNNSDVSQEIQKLQLVIAHKDEIIAHKTETIESLKSEVELLKKIIESKL